VFQHPNVVWRLQQLNDSRGDLPEAVVVVDAVIAGRARNIAGSPRSGRFEPRVRVACITLVATLPDDAECVVGAVSWTWQIVDPLSIGRLRRLGNVQRNVVLD